MSDLWGWVRDSVRRLADHDAAEARRLAELLEALPSATVDDEHERVDAMVPEALALARSLDEPWLELFIRHWNLQSRVLHRNLAREELREAVELLEFASRSRTADCPQSVCVVQDLACCYSISDGPGYVPERLAVARETLARIDPSWPCFDCISAEYFAALMDDERVAEALDFVEQQRAALAEAGEFELGSNLTLDRARALLALGRAAEALEVLDGTRDPADYGDSYAMHHRNLRVAVLLGLGRVDEAAALHPPASAILATPSHYDSWVRNLADLIAVGRVANEGGVGALLLRLQRRLHENGARFKAARVALTGARLAVDRGAREVARMLCSDLAALRAELRRPERLDPEIAEIEAELAALGPVVEAPGARAAVEAELRREGGVEAERALDVLVALRKLDPAAVELILEHARVLRMLGRAERAVELLRAEQARVAAGEGREGLLVELAEALLADGDHRSFDALLTELGISLSASEELAEIEGATRARLLWLRGRSLLARGQREDAKANDRALLELVPGMVGAHLRLAATARAEGDWATALAELEAVIDELEPGAADWDRITAATAVGDWAAVRASADRLGLELPPPISGDRAEPIDVDLGLVRVEYLEADGRRFSYWARRSSPCGARVIELAFPDDPQHYGDRVVFEARNLDESRDGARERVPRFPVVAILEGGRRRSFLVRGFDPGEAEFVALEGALAELDVVVERITAVGRSAADPREDGEEREVPTLAVLLGIPEDGDLVTLRQTLAERSAAWELPLLCPALDAAVGDQSAAEASAATLARWRP